MIAAAASLSGNWLPEDSEADASCATPFVSVINAGLCAETMKCDNSFHEPWNDRITRVMSAGRAIGSTTDQKVRNVLAPSSLAASSTLRGIDSKKFFNLDGVFQGPGRPDEDTRDGFRNGGSAEQDNDPAMGAAMGERTGQDFSWLFGRRSYDDLLTHWNQAGGPFKDGLNNVRKYVASSSPDADLPWPNSTLLSGDVPAEVAALRGQPGGNLVIMGSGQLIQSLLPHGLVDELLLMIHPLLLGSGHRLFGPEDEAHHLRLVDCTPTATGVLMATYQLVQQAS